jgi:hypothetical protein
MLLYAKTFNATQSHNLNIETDVTDRTGFPPFTHHFKSQSNNEPFKSHSSHRTTSWPRDRGCSRARNKRRQEQRSRRLWLGRTATVGRSV